MKITTTSGVKIEATPLSAVPDFNINYALIIKSDKKVRSIDRGASTDRYASEMVFRGKSDTIDALYHQLQLLRDASEEVVLSDFEDAYFGDHIDHSNAINCVVYKIEKLDSPVLRVKTFKIVFLGTDVQLIGTPQLPSLTCLDAQWYGYNEWNTSVNETYDRNNYFVDREADLHLFKGTYHISKDENMDLFRYYSEQRGTEFTVDDGSFGINGMFGPNVTSDTHDVVFKAISYKAISPTLREVTIELIRNSGADSYYVESEWTVVVDNQNADVAWGSTLKVDTSGLYRIKNTNIRLHPRYLSTDVIFNRVGAVYPLYVQDELNGQESAYVAYDGDIMFHVYNASGSEFNKSYSFTPQVGDRLYATINIDSSTLEVTLRAVVKRAGTVVFEKTDVSTVPLNDSRVYVPTILYADSECTIAPLVLTEEIQ